MPGRRTTPQGYRRAIQLRKQPTPAESALWSLLRNGRLRGVSFRRQHAIGPYVADFCSPRHKLIIEVDGSPHRNVHERDAARTAFLESRGYRVLRFWNSRVLHDAEGVAQAIVEALQLT